MRRRNRKKQLDIMKRIGIAVAFAGIALFILSADPYAYGVIGTTEFIKRMFWALILIFGGLKTVEGDKR